MHSLIATRQISEMADAAPILSLSNLPQFHIFDYMHIAHMYPFLRQNGVSLLDSRGLRHFAYLLVETPRRLRDHPNSVDRKEVFEGCCIFLHKGAHGELEHFHRSPQHGSARFCFRPETQRIEVCEVTFHYLGVAESEKNVIFFQCGGINDLKLGVHGGRPWCILRRSVRKDIERTQEFIYWSINVWMNPGFRQQLRLYNS